MGLIFFFFRLMEFFDIYCILKFFLVKGRFILERLGTYSVEVRLGFCREDLLLRDRRCFDSEGFLEFRF